MDSLFLANKPPSNEIPRPIFKRCIAVFFLALAVRLLLLGQQSIWFDEVLTLHVSTQPWETLVPTLQVAENTKPPVYFAFMHEWLRFGRSEIWLRLPSAIFGAVACALTTAIGNWLFRARGGWAVGAIVALSPLHLWYSQEARMYALLTTFGVATFLFNFRFLRTRAGWDLAAYGAFALLTCYTFTYGFFILAVGVLHPFFRRPLPSKKTLIQVVAASVVAALGFVPWIFMILEATAAGHGFQVSKGPVTQAIAYTLFALGFGSSLGPSTEALRNYKSAIFSVDPTAAGVLVGGFVLVLAVLSVGLIQLWRRERNAFWFSTIGIAVFCGGPALISFLQPRITYNPRYAILAVIPFAVTLVGALLPGRTWRFRAALVGLYSAAVLWSLWNHFFTPAYWKEDMREAIRLATSLVPPPEVIVVCPPYLIAAADYYASSLPPRRLLELTGPQPEAELRKLSTELAGERRWLLLYGRRDYGDPQNLVPVWLANHFEVLDRQKLSGVEVVTVGKKPPANISPLDELPGGSSPAHVLPKQ